MQNGVRGELELEGLKVRGYGMKGGESKYDMTMTVAEVGGEVRGGIEYVEELYEGETIRRMIRHYKEIMRGVIEEPERRVGELEMMSREEREERPGRAGRC